MKEIAFLSHVAFFSHGILRLIEPSLNSAQATLTSVQRHSETVRKELAGRQTWVIESHRYTHSCFS